MNRIGRDARAWLDLLRPLALLWFAGASLRIAVLALPPVLDELASAFRMKSTDIGALTAIPPLLFAVAAIPGAVLIGRFGPVPCLVVGLAFDAAGAAARSLADDVLMLELATAVVCFGIALMQPAMPSLVRAWLPERVGLASATYTFGLLFGEIAPTTWPVRSAIAVVREGWRAQLFVWSMPIVATLVAVAVLRPRTAARGDAARVSRWPDWSRRDVWWMGVLMGSIGAAYLTLNGFVPTWLRQSGAAGDTAAALMALNLAQLPAVLMMLPLAGRLAFSPPAYLTAGAALLMSSVLLAIGPAPARIAAAAAAGFCSAVLLALVNTAQPLVADEARLPALSAGTFCIGFGIAAIVALLTGWLERTGLGALGIVPVAAASLAIMAAGGTIGTIGRDAGSGVISES